MNDDSTLLLGATEADDARQARGLEPLKIRCQRGAAGPFSVRRFARHLAQTHHPHLRDRLRRAERAIVAVAATHGLAAGNTWELAKLFVDLKERLGETLNREHEQVSQAIYEESHGAGDSPAGWNAQEYSTERRSDHESFAATFEQIRSLTTTAGPSTDSTYREMLAEFAALEEDCETHWLEQETHLRSLQLT